MVLFWKLGDVVAPLVLLLQAAAALQLSSVQNFRPVVAVFDRSSSGLQKKKNDIFYRCATLDTLSVVDAELLISYSSPQQTVTVLDLRNHDEIEKGKSRRTEGAQLFYQHLTMENSASKLYHIPILDDIDAFWDHAISRLDPVDRMGATLQTIVSAGALDRAAARRLEQGGLAELYTVILATSMGPLQRALTVCLQQAQSRGGPVIFHCQKGKDRTGLLAMLIQHCCRHDDCEIVQSYSLSERLLSDETSRRQTKKSSSKSSSSGTMVDWAYFRGSPESAMTETLTYLREEYNGGINGYLDALGFPESQRIALRDLVSASNKK